MENEIPINPDSPTAPGNPIPSLSQDQDELNKQNTDTSEEYPANKSLRNMILVVAFFSFIALAAVVYYIWVTTDLPKVLNL